MESTQFDDLTRKLAAPASRRSSLRALGRGMTGGMLALTGLAGAEAGKKRKKKKKKKKKADCPDNCGQCGACVNGKCLEAPGLCDDANCEVCDPATWTCKPRCSGIFGSCCNGECRLTELGPWTDCGDFCCWAGSTCCGGQLCCNEGHICIPDCLGPGIADCCPDDNTECCSRG
jgi:hypothetical protein